MKFRTGMGSILLLGLLSGSLAAEIVDRQNVQVPAQGIERVRFEVEAGYLDIRGVAASTFDIQAEFDVETGRRSVNEILSRLEFRHELRGNTLLVTTRTDLHWNRGENARINLTVRMPAAVDVEIEDGSGWIRATDLDGLLDIRDGSGEITLANLGNDVVIQDGSGEIDVRGAAGHVEIRDGSGEITVADVGRGLQIDDSSGGIEVRGVNGDVVLSDSSGGIRVRDVEGNLEVVSDSTGGIHYDNIRGRVELPRRGY